MARWKSVVPSIVSTAQWSRDRFMLSVVCRILHFGVELAERLGSSVRIQERTQVFINATVFLAKGVRGSTVKNISKFAFFRALTTHKKKESH